MKNTSSLITSDRCIVFNSADEFSEFVDNPKGFLEEMGVLDGLPAYNGVRDSKEKLHQRLEKMRSGEIKRTIVLHVVGPVPDFCKYYILE